MSLQLSGLNSCDCVPGTFSIVVLFLVFLDCWMGSAYTWWIFCNFFKGGQLWDLLFVFLKSKALPKRSPLFKENICSFSPLENPLIREARTFLTFALNENWVKLKCHERFYKLSCCLMSRLGHNQPEFAVFQLPVLSVLRENAPYGISLQDSLEKLLF